MGDAAIIDSKDIAQEDILRAHVYDLLGALLREAPTSQTLQQLAGLSGDDTPLGSAIVSLSKVARQARADQAKREFHDLFVGLGRGELLPYASYYMTGFLNEKPLANLRRDMMRLTETPPSHLHIL